MGNLNSLILEIVNGLKRKEIVFFTGAGISYDEPAGLPLANDFKRGIIKTLCENQIALKGKDKNILRNIRELRPETLFQILYESLGDKGLGIINILKKGQPNVIHLFIAELAKRGYTPAVLTTNFDSLIEKAIKEYEFVQISSEEEYQKWEVKGNKFTIFKLHGTLEDEKGEDKIKTIQATLHQVGRPLGKGKTKILKHFLKNYHIVFLGYSGLDDFDIFPILLTTKSKKRYIG